MFAFLVDGLATHRLARLIVTDAIFDRPREHVKASLHAAGYAKAVEGLRCEWCVGVWVAVAVTAARYGMPRVWRPVARALATADLAGIVTSHV